MSKIDDVQRHVVVTTLSGTVVLDAPAGVIAPEGPDAANVSPTAALPAGGKAVAVNIAGVKLANPS